MRRWLAVAALGIAGIAQSAQAQGLRDMEPGAHDDTRISLSVTIPLGARRGSDEATPRMDLALDQRSPATSTSPTPLQFDPLEQERRYRLSALSLTLEQNPQFMVSGTRVATFGPRLAADDDREGGGGGSTALYVIGGLVAFGTIGTIILVTDTRDAVSDAIGPAD